MSGASSPRPAVFTRSPQSVEIYERGAWWPGSMLGWRHDASGRCQAWVRVEFAGVVEDAWVDLTLLRLPESRTGRHLVLAREPKGATASGRREVRSAPVSRPVEVARTQDLPLVRQVGAPAATGRPVPPAGGRRRAPEAGDQPAAAKSSTPGDPPLGRHRAPALPMDAGRHRAADTGVLDVVPADPTPVRASVREDDRRSPRPSRSELPPAGPVVRSAAVRSRVEPDLLTRPMRLDEGVGSAGRPRRNSLSGV